ncbi:ATP-binding protein [Streptomyces sp. SA15]|nr:ATP-binding protein [Streptomyces sp. SA15]
MVHPPEEGHACVGDGCLRTVEQARDVARGFLLVAAPDGGSAVDAVLLVVSELFANAVQHAGGVTEFRLEAGPGTVMVAVQDASTARRGPCPGTLASREGSAGSWCRTCRTMCRSTSMRRERR